MAKLAQPGPEVWMVEVFEDVLEHLNETERDCVRRYLSLLCDALGHELVEIRLFGSFARGDVWSAHWEMSSDIDLLVLVRSPIDDERLDGLLIGTYPLYLECGRQISPQFKTVEELENPPTERLEAFRERVEAEGRLLARGPSG